MKRRLLVIQVAGLAADASLPGLRLRAAESVFPAVTCTVQASFRTASPPSAHGMIANGLFLQDLRRPLFWEQSCRLVEGARFWQGLRRRGGRVAMLFWQQSLGEDADVLLSPAPIHKHHGGMIQDCYSLPRDLYGRLVRRLGPFHLRHYWGPLASAKSGGWIARATAELLAMEDVAPDLCLTYLPTLDYDLQRHGPGSPQARAAMSAVAAQLQQLLDAARERSYEVLVFGDCAMAPASGALYPNRLLRQAGLLETRNVKGMLYPDYHRSQAFAVADHEVAHVYASPEGANAAREALAGLAEGTEILDAEAQRERGIRHPRSGQLVLVAPEGRWLAYPWWEDDRQAPEFARHVDIHNKPGYDPCELFFGRWPRQVSLDAAKVRGTHGRIGPTRRVGWWTTLPLEREPATLIELAAAAADWLEERDAR